MATGCSGCGCDIGRCKHNKVNPITDSQMRLLLSDNDEEVLIEETSLAETSKKKSKRRRSRSLSNLVNVFRIIEPSSILNSFQNTPFSCVPTHLQGDHLFFFSFIIHFSLLIVFFTLKKQRVSSQFRRNRLHQPLRNHLRSNKVPEMSWFLVASLQQNQNPKLLGSAKMNYSTLTLVS